MSELTEYEVEGLKDQAMKDNHLNMIRLSRFTLKLLQERKENSLIVYMHKNGLKELANKLGVTTSAISRWVQGNRKVSEQYAQKLFEATDGEVDWRQ